jgi:glycogen synthase kinase 3 beta
MLIPSNPSDDQIVKLSSVTRLCGTPVDSATHSSSSSSCVYRAEKIIGNGSFGIVYQAVSEETGGVYAIKKVYQDRRYKNRELQIMKELGVHPNIVKLETAFYTSGSGRKPDELFLNLVMEYVPDTIYKLLKTSQRTKEPIPAGLTQCYMYQLARGLAYMHNRGVCHRDIKPQNLLICPTTHVLKLCDFGSAKRLIDGEPNVSYICSRYYRAPELIFGATGYSHLVDVWSLGCVLGELLTGSPIFPGENGVDQLVQIIKVIGTPTSEDLVAMNPNYTEFRFPPVKPTSWDGLVSDETTQSILNDILQYNPNKRLSCVEILSHNFFSDIKQSHNTPPALFEFNETELKYINNTSIFDCRTRSGSTD